MLPSLSIVYPMYNEKDNIETAVREALRVGYQMASQLEIIVVDDASTDGCGEIADRLACAHPEVRVVHHERNRKLGGALRSGFAAAQHEWILYLDSDLPIRMDDALQALPLAASADMVIGWRISRAESPRREIMSWVYNRLIRWGFGLRVRDVNFAFKLFKRSFYRRIQLRSEGSFIDAELLLEMRHAGVRLVEMPMHYYPRVAGVSTLSSWSVVWKILEEMTRYRTLRWLPQRFHESYDRGRERRRFRAEHGR
ncbi:MAG: glycosyltransferase family 2 protein [Armatimonadota bacterium]|nr:glycosyltransferase family 2 protein [Armatimonadota bacterium]